MLKLFLLSTVMTATTTKLTRLYKLFAQVTLGHVKLNKTKGTDHLIRPRHVGSELGRIVCFIIRRKSNVDLSCNKTDIPLQLEEQK